MHRPGSEVEVARTALLRFGACERTTEEALARPAPGHAASGSLTRFSSSPTRVSVKMRLAVPRGRTTSTSNVSARPRASALRIARRPAKSRKETPVGRGRRASPREVGRRGRKSSRPVGQPQGRTPLQDARARWRQTPGRRPARCWGRTLLPRLSCGSPRATPPRCRGQGAEPLRRRTSGSTRRPRAAPSGQPSIRASSARCTHHKRERKTQESP